MSYSRDMNYYVDTFKNWLPIYLGAEIGNVNGGYIILK